MISLKIGMDPHSREIVRVNNPDDEEHVGYVHWHPGKEPRIVFSEAFTHLTISEVQSVLSGYRATRDSIGGAVLQHPTNGTRVQGAS